MPDFPDSGPATATKPGQMPRQTTWTPSTAPDDDVAARVDHWQRRLDRARATAHLHEEFGDSSDLSGRAPGRG